jgi:tetratricopeptide (TPR) repeat protein|tara:strand:- start:1080 stop:1760 length:681 start_codon:yes stop_codon:yes gene_type:complete
MNLENLTELELYFADHFDTVLFPVLAEIYQDKAEYDRAKRVCEIGLEHHPNSIDGQFILSQAELGLGNLSAAEKWMKKVLTQISDHKNAATSLPMVQEQLDRSPTTLKTSWKRAQEVDPDNQFAKDFLSTKTSKTKTKPKKKKEKKASVSTIPHIPKKEKSKKPLPKDLSVEGVAISPRLATMTLVNVLKGQGLYHQALEVLDILEEKGEDKKRIAEERKAIKSEL